MIKTEVRPLVGFEEDYARYVERKARVEDEVKAEYEKVLAERTAKLNELIALTSEIVEIEIPDENTEEVVEEVTSNENLGEY